MTRRSRRRLRAPFHDTSLVPMADMLTNTVGVMVFILIFTVLVKAHLADCGNAQPTSYVPTAQDVYEEGALIFPAVQVQEAYEDRVDVVRMCMERIRVPEQWRGDYLGLLGAVRIGEREVLALGEELGWALLDRYAESWFDYSEERMLAAIGLVTTARARTQAAGKR